MQMMPSTRLSRKVSSAVCSGWIPSAHASRTEYPSRLATCSTLPTTCVKKPRVMSVMTSPSVPVREVTSPRARAFGRYPSSRATSRTRSRVVALAYPGGR